MQEPGRLNNHRLSHAVAILTVSNRCHPIAPQMQKYLGFLLLLCAYAMLVPGLTQPMLSVTGTVEKARLVEVGKELLNESPNTPAFVADLANMLIDNLDVSGTVSAFDKTRSILGTAMELYTNQHALVAVLIVLFSVVIPVIKGLIVLSAQLPVRDSVKHLLLSIGNAVSKWSMADVFVIGIFIAFLAANGIQDSAGLVDFDARLGTGFYYFLGYCLVSILATQLIAAAGHRQLK